jgi:hypothetical protein
MVKIVFHKFGSLKKEFAEYILRTINGCYDKIKDYVVDIVDLILFEKSSIMNSYLNREKRNLGIKNSSFEASYFAVHDAWYGTPRIMVACDRMLTLPGLVRTGVLHHEVAHTILHGSLDFYSFPPPILLLKRKEIPRQIVADILYLVSVAVKDYEVTCLLYDNELVEDQVAYCKYILEPNEEDYEAWNLAKENNFARLLVLSSLLKPLCCAAPLLKDEKYSQEINESFVKAMSYLPSEFSVHVSNLIEATSEFGKNTHENVDLFIKRIIKELMLEGDS